jgi:NADH dehydrogenase
MRGMPRVVIIGGGFGGRNAAKALRSVPVEVTVIDRTNHHLFQPLLYQVATATLAPTDITAPIRWLLRSQRNADVLLAEVTGIDIRRRIVTVDRSPHEVPYDYLVVASGSRHAYFGHEEWEALAPGLKSLGDAVELRRRFLLAFELAEWATNKQEQGAYQTFVVVGGGPTGVELAGMIPDIARRAMRREFRHVDTALTRVILLEGGPRLLPSFPEKLSHRARRDLEELGVEVRTGAIVTNIDADAVWIGDERISTHTVMWAAGNAASPLTRHLGVELDRAGRVAVNPDLSVPGHPDIFAVGDVATVVQDGRPVPGVAQGAIQMGTTAARNIGYDVARQPRRPFHYRNKGDLATIGRNRAIADFGHGVTVSGFIAWLIWIFVHILNLAGFRNRATVLIEWAYAYFTYQRGARLLTDRDAAPRTPGDHGEAPLPEGATTERTPITMAAERR